MKKYLIAFLIVFVSVACWQCGDKGEDDPAPDPKIEITGSPEVNLPAAGGNGVISQCGMERESKRHESFLLVQYIARVGESRRCENNRKGQTSYKRPSRKC